MPSEIREIITKAVIGKGHLKNKVVYTLDSITNVSSILGCWIVNHLYHAQVVKEKLYVDGQFDLNIWYSLDDDKSSQVHVETVFYKDELKIIKKDEDHFDGDIMLITTCPQSPVCLDAVINEDGKVMVTCEKTLHVDIVGETKICVEISKQPEIWEEIDKEVDPSFLEK